MRQWVKLFLAACLYYGGVVKLVRWWFRHFRRGLIILNYHQASGGDLRSHMLYLRRHFRILHLEEALEELFASNDSPPKGRRDRRSLAALTFDDGHHDNYTHAFALARELQLPITFFLVPGYIDGPSSFWWTAGERLLRLTHCDEVSLDGIVYHLYDFVERQTFLRIIDTIARNAYSVEERETFLEQVRKALGVSVEDFLKEELVLSWDEIREMQASGLVSFGAHTMHHPVLAFLKSMNELCYEVAECRNVLTKRLGKPVRIFAYPIGKGEHISSAALRAVREAGYDWAVTTIPGLNTPQSLPHELRRVGCSPDRHWLVMAAETVGIWQLVTKKA